MTMLVGADMGWLKLAVSSFYTGLLLFRVLESNTIHTRNSVDISELPLYRKISGLLMMLKCYPYYSNQKVM